MKFIPLMRVDLQESDILAASNVLKTGMLLQGKNVVDLEERFSSFTAAEHAVAVSSGTASLHLLLLANEIGIGDEVILPAFSYVATANVVEIVGAKPIFVEVNRETFTIDTSKIEPAITNRTRAIIPVHEFGLSAEMSKILNIAERHGLIVLEDAACSLGAYYGGQHTGTLGLAGSFSFHPRKAITSGEGGMICTNDKELAQRCRILRNQGIQLKDEKMEFIEAGLNYRMTDFQAALLLSQFDRLDDGLKRKREIATYYSHEIKNLNIQLPKCVDRNQHSWQTFHLILSPNFHRDHVISKLKEKGIGTNYGAQCIPAVEYYEKKYQLDFEKLYPNALQAYKSGLAIPLYSTLTSEELMYIAEQLNKL